MINNNHKIHSEGIIKLHQDYPETRLVFVRKEEKPLMPQFCPVCGRINAFTKYYYDSIFYYGMCNKCFKWWEDEETISIDKNIKYKTDKFIKEIENKTEYKLEIDWDNMTYKSVKK